MVASAASVVLDHVEALLLAVDLFEGGLYFEATSTSRPGGVEEVHLRVPGEDPPSVRVQVHSIQLGLLEEAGLDGNHSKPPQDALEVLFCDVVELYQLVALKPFPTHHLMHLRQDAVGQPTCHPLAGAELFEEVLSDGLLRAGRSLLASEHEVPRHLGNLFAEFVVHIEDVGVEDIVVIRPQHRLEVCSVLRETYSTRTEVQCDLVHIETSFGQGQASLAELEGSRDSPEGLGVDLLQAANGRLQHRVDGIQEVPLDADIEVG